MYTCEADYIRGYREAETLRERVAIATSCVAFIGRRMPDYADPFYGLWQASYDLWKDRALGWAEDSEGEGNTQ